MALDLTSSVRAVMDRLTTFAPTDRRLLVAVAGPPGAGKSTLAQALVDALNRCDDPARRAALVPMDGFHRDNSWLEGRGLRGRKGAPETFDIAGFTALITKIRADDGSVSYPGFDRATDATVPDAHQLAATERIVVAEGNYLLLDEPDWRDLAALFDLTVFTTPSAAELERRLVARWLHYGLDRRAAEQRAHSNDLPNATRVLDHRLRPDLEF